jgi:predicted HNH restriction endonuclease
LQVHHIVSLEDGGAEFDLNNLVTLCNRCHGAQHPGERSSTGRAPLTSLARFSRKKLYDSAQGRSFSKNKLS